MTKPFFTIHRAIKPRGAGLTAHVHDEGQLTFAASGMVQVHTGQGVWLVPPQLAAWIPPGVEHRLEILSEAELWMVHWPAAAIREWAPPGLLKRAFCLKVTLLLRALLATAVAPGLGEAKAELLVRLVLHEILTVQDAPTFLPLPTSPAARRAPDVALGDHRNLMSVDEVASRAATSVRTLSRLFPAETGLTFKAWRQRARIVRSMARLAGGNSIAQVALDAGYASTAAFSHAFRQVTTMTPTAFQVPVLSPWQESASA